MPKTALLLVEIQMNEEGEVKSTHRPLSARDQGELESWPSGGLVQMAHALFVEALRRESYTMALSKLSTGTEIGALTAEMIEELTRAQVIQMTNHFSRHAAEEVLQRLRPR